MALAASDLSIIYLDGPGEGEGGRSGDGGHVRQTGGERERRGGGGHEERESDGEVAGLCCVGWSWMELEQ